MTSFATAGEVAEGDELMGGVTSGADEGLLSGLEGAVDGLASGEFEACWLFGSVQPASTKTNPATHAAGTAPLLSRP